MECYDNTNELYETEETVDTETQELVEWIEKTYDCSGLDSKPKFYVSRSVYDGPPERACGEPLSQLVNDSLVMMGILMLVSSFANFLIFSGNIAICVKNRKNKVEPSKYSDVQARPAHATMVSEKEHQEKVSDDARGEPHLGPPPMRGRVGKEVNDSSEEPQAVNNSRTMDQKQAVPENFTEVTSTSKLPALGGLR